MASAFYSAALRLLAASDEAGGGPPERLMRQLRAAWGVSEAQHASLWAGISGHTGGQLDCVQRVGGAGEAPDDEQAHGAAQAGLAATRERALDAAVETFRPLLSTRDVCVMRAVCRAWSVRMAAPEWYEHIRLYHYYEPPEEEAAPGKPRRVPFKDEHLNALLVRGAGGVRSVFLAETWESGASFAGLAAQSRLVHVAIEPHNTGTMRAIAGALTGLDDAADVVKQLVAGVGTPDAVRRCALALEALHHGDVYDDTLAALQRARPVLVHALVAHDCCAAPEAAHCALRLLRKLRMAFDRENPPQVGDFGELMEPLPVDVVAPAECVRAAAATLRALAHTRPNDAGADGALQQAVLTLVYAARPRPSNGNAKSPEAQYDKLDPGARKELLLALPALEAMLRRGDGSATDGVASVALAALALIHVTDESDPHRPHDAHLAGGAALERASVALRAAMGGDEARFLAAVRAALLRLDDGGHDWLFDAEVDLTSDWLRCGCLRGRAWCEEYSGYRCAPVEEETKACGAAAVALAFVALRSPGLHASAADCAVALIVRSGARAAFPAAPPAGAAASVVPALRRARTERQARNALAALRESTKSQADDHPAEARAAFEAGALPLALAALETWRLYDQVCNEILVIMLTASNEDRDAEDAMFRAGLRLMPGCPSPMWVGLLSWMLQHDYRGHLVHTAATLGAGAVFSAALRDTDSAHYALLALFALWKYGGAARAQVEAADVPALAQHVYTRFVTKFKPRFNSFGAYDEAAAQEKQEFYQYIKPLLREAADAMAPLGDGHAS